MKGGKALKSSQVRHTLKAAPKTSDHFGPLGLGIYELYYNIENQSHQARLRLLTKRFQPASDIAVVNSSPWPANW